MATTNQLTPITAPLLAPPTPGLADTAGSPSTFTPTATPTPAIPAATATPVPPVPIAPVATYAPVSGVAGTVASKGYDPTPYVVPEQGLVQQQIKEIVEKDSPLMQQARVKAMQVMNERGLANSTLNTEAGQNAVIAQALPIASQDAASVREAAFKTAEAQNTASQFGAAAENSASSTNAQLVTSMNTTNANAANTALSANAQAENVRNLSLIDTNTKLALASMDASNRQALQTNANLANMFQETVKNIAAIAVDQKLTRDAKDRATATQLNLLKEGLRTTAEVGSTLPSDVADLNLDAFFQANAPVTAAQTAAKKKDLSAQIVTAKAAAKKPGLTPEQKAAADAALKALQDQYNAIL